MTTGSWPVSIARFHLTVVGYSLTRSGMSKGRSSCVWRGSAGAAALEWYAIGSCL